MAAFNQEGGTMDETTSVDRDEANTRLNELILEHLGIPQPRAGQHPQPLQDYLPPLQTA
jgi:hypothetical protein